MNKKKMVTVLGSATLIGAIGIGGTLAYLTDGAYTVSNTFVLGKGIKIDLKESKVGTETDVTDDNSVAVQALKGEAYGYDLDGENKWTVTKNEYASVHPGETVYKDPTVLVAEGSENAYIYVTVKNASTEAVDKATQYQIDVLSDWELVETDEVSDVLIYRHKGLGEAGKNYTLFTNARIRGNKEGEVKPEKLNDLDVKAYAVQAHGVKQATADAEAIKLIKASASGTQQSGEDDNGGGTQTPEQP
ncbi:hypothetical protein [Lachnobacterium bovis]|uniref:SipW-cognate class signal peptide n=1 Tax=Lachnobacterium bovis TaxID=140626 RepID=A0A1H9TEP6_9FIRM|nr:hypothetical protein [Lachnobacterium bovis]SER95800.1 hypothetical protein SAMN02910429_01615 [Lachnobacterium bovis]